jgi:lysophospholipase L1-like esterase
LPNISGAWKKALLSNCILCLVLLFLASCGSASSGTTVVRSSAVQQSPKARLTYLAIGASDAFGLGADDPQTQNWAADLARQLGSGVHLINLGIPGITLHQALNVELPVALDTHPNLITIWLAVNDIGNFVPPVQYAKDLETLLSRLQAADPHAVIEMANVPDLRLLPYFQQRFNQQLLYQQVLAYNVIIAAAAQRHHVILIDLFNKWQILRQHPEYISSDGFHPSTLGYEQLANLFYQTVVAATHGAIQ